MLRIKLKTMRLWFLLALLSNFLRPADVSAGPLYYDQLNSLQKSYWLKLLHYQNGKSRADGEGFFLSPQGKTSPALEMQADLEAFGNPKAKSGWFGLHPQCVFRERFAFLKELELLNAVKELPCEDFFKWKKGLNAESVTLVFSSSYPNNPSSLFGHTLIRLNQKNKSKGTSGDLLDYAVAFSAVPEKEDIGLVFAYKGMFGGYKGILEVTKYYTKVTEYNNGESRDLLEYDLQMTSKEIDRLINHLWEIYQTTYFDYYFADENCSAVLVDILAVAFDEEGINHHEHWYYLPSEMIKVFEKFPYRIKSRGYRASLKKQLEKQFDALSGEELIEVRSLAEGTHLPAGFSKARVLDGVISLLDFTRYRTKDQLSLTQSSLLRAALVRRASLPQNEEQKILGHDQSNRPELGHESRKWSFFLRTEESHSLIGIEYKDGYHDLLSNDLGYDPFSQFDFFTGSLVYDRSLGRLSYDQLTFVNLVSLHPYTFYDPQFSWAAKVVSDRLYGSNEDLNCELCHKLNARAYLGPSLAPSHQMMMSFLTGVFAEASPHFSRGFRAGVGIEASLLFTLGPKLKIGFFDEIRFNALEKIKSDYFHHLTFKQSYFSGKNTEWRFESSMVSKATSLDHKTWINQLNYGFYF